jgi:hypothetical protein
MAVRRTFPHANADFRRGSVESLGLPTQAQGVTPPDCLAALGGDPMQRVISLAPGVAWRRPREGIKLGLVRGSPALAFAR